MYLLIAILATQEPRKWSEISLSSLQSGIKFHVSEMSVQRDMSSE